ncbi:MAG: hypothetical protein ACFFCD_04380 [Promethearchaeota archaeon]
MHDYAYSFCFRCKRKEWITFSQEDIIEAKKTGGLFKMVLDHDDHFLELQIDVNGAVRRENIIEKVPANISATISS